MTDLQMLLYLLDKSDVPKLVLTDEDIEYYNIDTGESWKEVYPTLVRVRGINFKFNKNGELVK